MAVKTARSGLGWAIDALLRDAPALLAPLGVSPDDADAVTVLYGLELASRYVADGQLEAGAAVGAVDTWLVPALAQFLSRSIEVPS